MLKTIRKTFRKLGFDIVKYPRPDIQQSLIGRTVSKVLPYTMTSPERIFVLCEAVKYITSNDIPGDIVECGVWKGGSMMAVADTLLSLNSQTRHLYLFDTFEGMTEPTDNDISTQGISASEVLRNSRKEKQDSVWCYATLEEVKAAVHSVDYDKNKIHFVKGKVEDTIPEYAPEKISLLRLDTDWYESTRHELIHLFPRISPGGVIIIDDYGCWEGAKKAVDEYVENNKISLLLNRIDSSGRIGLVLKH